MKDLDRARNAYLKLKGGTFKMRGDSMKPLFRDGSVLKVEAVETNSLEIGNVIIFSKEPKNILICHRIVGKFKLNNEIHYLEKGDNSESIGLIVNNDITGRVRYVVKNKEIEAIEQVCVVNRFFLHLVCIMIAFHSRFSKLIKIILFSKETSKLPISLGRIMQRFYCLLLRLSLKVKK